MTTKTIRRTRSNNKSQAFFIGAIEFYNLWDLCQPLAKHIITIAEIRDQCITAFQCARGFPCMSTIYCPWQTKHWTLPLGVAVGCSEAISGDPSDTHWLFLLWNKMTSQQSLVCELKRLDLATQDPSQKKDAQGLKM